MSRVDFYILPDESRQSMQRFACRLAEKAYLQGHKVLIQTESAEEARQMDDLLWTLQDDNFIPHGIFNASSSDVQPVVIYHSNEKMDNINLLINLSSLSMQDQSVERIAEILNQQTSRKQTGREHYKTYRNSGFDMHHHEIKPS